MARRLPLLLIVLGAIALAATVTGHALAHANLVRSLPPAGAVLESAPAQVQLWFSEQPEVRSSSIQVLDAQGSRIDMNNTAPASDDPLSLVTGLKEDLPSGTYTIAWRVLSAVDGHVTMGIVPFVVGSEATLQPAAQVTPESSTSAGPTAAEVAIRWLMLAGLLVATGAFAFTLLVWRRALHAANLPAAAQEATSTVPRRLAWVALAGVVVGAVFSTALLFLQAARLGDAAFGVSLGHLMLGTRLGYAWWARLTLLIAASFMAWRWARAPSRAAAPLLGMVLVTLALLSVSVVSHGAAAFRLAPAAVLGDWMHLTAAGTWAGALPALLLTVTHLLRRANGASQRQLLALVVARFSDVALLSVGAIVVTGILNAYLNVGSPRNVLPSTYGLALLAKTGIFLAMLGFGALNLFYVRPRLDALARRNVSKDDARAPGLLRKSLTAEVLLVALIFLASGLLTSVDPARPSPKAGGPTGRVVRFERHVGDIALTFRVQQTGMGRHRLALAVGGRGQPEAEVDKAVVRLTYLVRDLGTSEVALTPKAPGTYEAEGVFLPLAGTWNLDLLPLHPSSGTAPERFRITVVASGLVYETAEPQAPSKTGQYVALGFGGALAAGAMAAIFRSGMLPKRKRRQAALTAGGGLLAGVLGVAMLLTQLRGAPSTAGVPPVNPFPATEVSVAKGHALYQLRCQVCHGSTGRGDGPAAKGLAPPPADLSVHVPLHSDRQLFVWIRDGLPGTAMPAFRDKLSEEEMWHLLNAIKQFAPKER